MQIHGTSIRRNVYGIPFYFLTPSDAVILLTVESEEDAAGMFEN